MSRKLRGLYFVTPDWHDTERLCTITAAALRGGATCVQYRNKTAPASTALAQASALAALCREHAALFIVNDSIELARASHADGVHLGRGDGDIAAARTALGNKAIIGASCYNDFSRARLAAAASADYIAFGAMFPSPTKPQAVSSPISLIGEAKHSFGLPVACIGGITADNAAALLAAGADLLAVISDICEASSPEQRARQIAQLFENPS